MEEERKREIAKLVRVLHQIAFAEKFSAWSERREDLSRFSAQQYNRVFARLKEIEPSIAGLFVEVQEDANPRVIRMAAHELAGYFEEELAPEEKQHRGYGRKGCGSRKRVVVGFAPMFGGHCR
jgi:hypothetical protein